MYIYIFIYLYLYIYVCVHIYIYILQQGPRTRGHAGAGQEEASRKVLFVLEVGLYTILPFPISYGIYCNKGGSGDIIYCAIVWAMRSGEGAAQTKGVFAKYSTYSCT